MTPHIIYLATADARGHLMRAQLLVHALRKAGAQVEVLTTSEAGRRFLASFGIDAPVLSQHYAVQFDERQNMLRRATNRNVAHYVFRPTRMLVDIDRLRLVARNADLLVNDSFHPALLFMGMLPGWRRKILHVYGASLKTALLANFDGVLPRVLGRTFARIVGWQIDAALSCIEHDFAYEADGAADNRRFQLPTPVALASPPSPERHHDAAVYLNPHFRDASLADALTAGLDDAGLTSHRVGEGYAGRAGWQGVDPNWASCAAHARLIVSAPGMAALAIAQVYRRPIVLVLTDQPEQASNVARAKRLGLLHRVVTWRGDADDFRRQVADAAHELAHHADTVHASSAAGRQSAQARVDAWTERLIALCASGART
ncbi:hypothetical protein [Paraburkholderia bryophila]|uniref:UDP:flavonoid glycosyltransferase YjiC (YdhE family) n=1 Tax=Paraburkholderia bryophila TaxID=420952 RepID=A0A7Y9W8M0_9BURK|nr:hypothetical protein [Paraburkholderia bryophila]NYH16227.1 hypothetical protein [Paraburkholderia bryophila]